MTDAQLYLAIGLPSIVALIGILVNIGYFIALFGRMTALETRMSTIGEETASHKTSIQAFGKRIDELEKRIDARFAASEKTISEKIDNAFAHMELLLKLHVAEHHKK